MTALLKLSRAIGRLQYGALRLPLSKLAVPAMARLYSDDAVPRLRFDKALGSLDALAGRLLVEPNLRDRGAAKIRDVEALERAKALEHAATASREQAAQVRQETARTAQVRRRTAQEKAAADIEAVRAEHRAEAAAASKKSTTKAAAATVAAARTAERKLQAEALELQNNLDTIEKAGSRRADGPKAKLAGARAAAAGGAARRGDADRLARLAENEKRRRASQ